MYEKIYKVRAWVNQSKREKRGGLWTDRVYSYEEVIVDHPETARSVYEKTRNEVAIWEDLSGYQGRVELFEPHIFYSGALAYWPDDEKYIAVYDFGM